MNKASLKKCADMLNLQGYVDYGVLVPRKILEEAIGAEYCEDWSWRGPILQLRLYFEELGYFVSERGTDDGDIRFLSREEIPEHLHKRRMKRYDKMSVDLKVCKKLPTNNLNDKILKNLHHEQDRLARDITYISNSDPEFKKIFMEKRL